MIIDTSYFVGKINLPQTGNTEGAETVNQFIGNYEPDYLKRVLGYSLWKAFTDGIAGSGVVDQRWTDLLEGKEFTIGAYTLAWPGFEAKPSPISQYVYYQYVRDLASSMSQVGNTSPQTANADRVNSLNKMVDAWNEMVELNYFLAGFLQANKTIYPEWAGVDPGVIGWAWEYGRTVYRDGVFKKINEFGI